MAFRDDLSGGPPARVARFDRITFEPGEESLTRLPNGMVELSGVATRVGVFDYLTRSGGIFRELRPEGEVFDPASLETLRGVPFTLDHPDPAVFAGGSVTADNFQQLTHGHVLDVWRDGDLVMVRVRVSTTDALRMIDQGVVQLSCGYTTELDPTSGVTRDGEAFDAIQTEIRYNHLALVDLARAGPVARLRLDSADDTAAVQRPREECTTMKTLILKRDGKDFQLKPWLWPSLYDADQQVQAAQKRGDQIETGRATFEVGGETVDLQLTATMIEELLAMVGAMPAPEPAAAEPVVEVEDLGGPDNPGQEDPLRGDGNKTKALTAEDVAKQVQAQLERHDAKARHRATVEREAGPVLGETFDWRQDTQAIQVAVIKSVLSEDATVAATRARRGDGRSQGELDALFRIAVKQHRDNADRSGVIAANLSKARGDGKSTAAPAEGETSRVDSARTRALAKRLNGGKRPTADGEGAPAN